MKSLGALNSYLDFIYKNEKFDKEEIKKTLLSNSYVYPDYKKIKILKDRSIAFNNIIQEIIIEIKSQPYTIKDFPEQKQEYSTSEICKKLIVHRTTYNSWKKKGYFKNEYGTVKKRKVPISDINDFLIENPKYESIWDD